MKKNISANEQLIRNFFKVVENDFDDVLSDLESRNNKQLAEMEIIKNMVNECIRELFENFEVDIEETCLERKSSLSSKVKNFFEENQENFANDTQKIEKNVFSNNEKKEKLSLNSQKKKSEKMHSENLILYEKNNEKEGSAKSETKNLEENQMHDISFSVNQSNDVKNGIAIKEEPKKKNSQELFNQEKAEKNEIKQNSTKNPKEVNRNNKKNIINIEKSQESQEKQEKRKNEKSKEQKIHENFQNKFNKMERNEKNEKLGNAIEKKAENVSEKTKATCNESEKKQKDKKMKEKAFRSYIAPHLSTNKTIQELINNSNCKKQSQALNESNPSNPSIQIHKTSEDQNRTNPEQNQSKAIKNEVLLKENTQKNVEEKKKDVIIHNRNKSEDTLLKKNEKGEFLKSKEKIFISEKKNEENFKANFSSERNEIEPKSKSQTNVSGSNNNYHTEVKNEEISSGTIKERDATPTKKNPLGQNKFLNYYYFFEDKKQ